ncbi:unnamed protein product [Cylindrotheca closterium]|uniref:Uncharacterized protein n=1 Tax=Cylindrotheca closterium TaxID=2856 RepID=A0AAD2PX91_9STRA|nr:unnamed protein product [Cylindrotheca closterium]
MDLWATLPCPSILHGNGLLNVAAAQPLLEQFARYIMGMALDCALFGPCDVEDRQAIRQHCQVGAWLERARQCYPPALGYHGTPDHFAYLSVLCPPEDGWPWPEFSTWLSDLPFDTLPDRYQRFEPKEIPVKARAVFVPAILVEKEDPDSDLDAYANVFATTATTVTATPNIATVPAPAPNVVTPSPPKEAPLPPVRQLASPPSVPQDVLDAMQKVSAFQEQIVHGTSAGTPTNPVDLVAGDVEEYDIRPNDLATRFASSANDSFTAAVMQAGNIADRRRSSLAQGKFGAGPRMGSLGLAPMQNDMFNLQTLAAALGVRQSCFVSADKASLASVQARRTCSPYFLNVALILASFFPQEEQPYLCLSDDRVVAATDWMKVPEPTQLARDLIAVWDHGHKEATSGVTRTLHYALRFRADIATDFQQIPLPYEAEFDLLNFAMHKSICDVARWKMGRKVPPPPVGGPSWHIFQLLPKKTQQWIRFMGGIRRFRISGIFVWPKSATFAQTPSAHRRRSLMEMPFSPMHSPVDGRSMCFVWGGYCNDVVAGAFVVAPTMVGRHEFTKKPLCYLDKFQLLYERVERKWDPAELDVNGHTLKGLARVTTEQGFVSPAALRNLKAWDGIVCMLISPILDGMHQLMLKQTGPQWCTTSGKRISHGDMHSNSIGLSCEEDVSTKVPIKTDSEFDEKEAEEGETEAASPLADGLVIGGRRR